MANLILKTAKQMERKAKDSAELRMQISTRNIMEQKKKEEKEKRETAFFFVSEIERIKAQLNRLSQSDKLEDKMRIGHYNKRLEECTQKMEKKFSKEEIEKARKKFASRPNPFLFEDNNGNCGR